MNEYIGANGFLFESLFPKLSITNVPASIIDKFKSRDGLIVIEAMCTRANYLLSTYNEKSNISLVYTRASDATLAFTLKARWTKHYTSDAIKEIIEVFKYHGYGVIVKIDNGFFFKRIILTFWYDKKQW